MTVIQRDAFDQELFTKWIGLSRRIYAENPYKIFKSPKDYQSRLDPQSHFSRSNVWSSFSALDEKGNLLGHLIVSAPKDRSTSVAFSAIGDFEAIDDEKVACDLFQKAWEWTALKILPEMRGPMDGNFFNSYRIQLSESPELPFAGEPLFPAYYHKLFQNFGFTVSGEWSTFKVDMKAQIELTKRMLPKVLAHGDYSQVKFIPVTRKNWNESIRKIYDLFIESYSGMSEYQPISFEEFKETYDSYRYIIKDRTTVIAERHGVPVGFLISFFDPLKILLQHQKSRNPFRKLIALFQLRKNRENYLIPYIGKTNQAKDLPGIPLVIFNHVLESFTPDTLPEYYLGNYVKTDSRAKGVFPLDHAKEVNRYVLYRYAPSN
jgi:hypothetical protein